MKRSIVLSAIFTNLDIPAVVQATPCFADTSALQDAVNDFINQGCSSNMSCDILSTWGPIRDWCTSLIDDMSYLFSGTDFNEDISGWDTSHVTSMSYMFESTSDFNQDISSWNTSLVEDMSYMFYYAEVFDGDISGWDTRSVTTMEGMFSDATVFNQAISGWNTRSVTTMEHMFYYAEAFNNDLSSWNVESATNMYGIFEGASVFNGDISGWVTMSATTMESLFYGAVAFNRDISNWNVESVLSMESMFDGASAFNQDISVWNTASVQDMGYMFRNTQSFNQDISVWDISSVTDMIWMFKSAVAFNQDLCRWKSNLPYNSVSDIFLNSGCANQGTPTDSSSPFCAAGPNCVVPACPARFVHSIRITSTTQQDIQMFEFRAYTDSGIEVAQGKAATQSSIYNNDAKYSAIKAIDGDGSTFSHTGSPLATWEVDLGQDYSISLVSIKNRYCRDISDQPGCLCRLSHAKIDLLDNQGSVVKFASFDDTCGDFYPSLEFDTCSESCLVKKVKLESTRQGRPIQIFELQAYSSGVNVALLGSASQSSTFNDLAKFQASNAIDGNNSTFSHTKFNIAWIDVDLAVPVDIEQIVILNRWCGNSSDPKGCLCRLSDSIVTLYNENGLPVSTQKIGDTCASPLVLLTFMPCLSTR